jgi:2-polyprenyl-6-hydroxyphenyl methylase/3-demethylubiquinone-9 3-methyltransferase
MTVTSVRSTLPPGAAFHDGLAANWTDGYRGGSFLRRLTCLQSILRNTVKAGEVWLDLGCGSGVLTAELGALGATVISADGSPAMLAHARAQVKGAESQQLGWLQCDVQAIPLRDGAVDGVLCSSVLEYVEQPTLALEEAARVTRSGGKLIFSVPLQMSALRSAQKWGRRIANYAGFHPFSYLSASQFEVDPRTIAGWCAQAGLAVDRTTGFDPWLPPAAFGFLRPSLLIIEARKERGA